MNLNPFPDLNEFVVIPYKEKKGTVYIDLMISTERNTNINNETKSLSIKDEPFAVVFSSSFNKTCKQYDFTGYGEATNFELSNLLKDLQDNQKIIENINSYGQFVNYCKRDDVGYIQIYENAPHEIDKIIAYRDAMNLMNKRIVEFCKDIINSDQILSIYGL